MIRRTEIKNLPQAGVISRIRSEASNIRISRYRSIKVNPVQTERRLTTGTNTGILQFKRRRDRLGSLLWNRNDIIALAEGGKVCGVEIIPAAIEDARENVARNGADNVEFFVGKAEEVLRNSMKKIISKPM